MCRVAELWATLALYSRLWREAGGSRRHAKQGDKVQHLQRTSSWAKFSLAYILFALFFLFPSAKTCLCVRKKGSQARPYAPGPSISTYQIGVV